MKCQNCGFELQEQDRFCKKCGSKVERPAAPAQVKLDGDYIPSIWPEWKMEKKAIGQGTYGTVYKAVRNDHNVQSTAAIKVITIPANPSEIESLRSEGMDYNGTKTYFEDIVNDFVKEIQLMESLKGMQNIVSVEDYKVVEKTGEIGWNIYIRMELLTPFNVHICDKKLTEEEVINLGVDICTALEVCAQRNIIHRDIKPENIFINNFGCYKLGDFGIARKLENVTGGLSQKGSPNYMAPEVASGKNYDNRVDTYSLGIVLYRLLNNNLLPLLDRNKQIQSLNDRREALERRLHGEALPAPCEASEAMADLILRACAFDPAIRFASATEMKQALQSVSNGTYQPVAAVLDQTTAVHKAPDELDQTKSVRKAPGAAAKNNEQSVNTFDHKPKKKSKLPAVIAIILAVALLAGAGAFAFIKLRPNDDGSEDTSGNEAVKEDEYSRKDEDQIAAIISEAEALAVEEDYEGAISKIETGLVTYPQSENLKKKLEEYTAARSAQIKANVLAEAEAFAQAGDYEAAMNVIKNAQKTYGDDADYQSAYEKYDQAYKAAVKADALKTADELAKQEDYLGALGIIESAIATVGEDVDLTAKAEEYENAYVDSVVKRVDEMVANEDYAGAEKTVKSALQELPDNAVLLAKLAEIEKSKPISLTALAAINNENWKWNDGIPTDPFGNDYSNSCNYAILSNGNYRYGYSIEYRIDSAYSRIKGLLAPYTSIGENGYAYVQIFADDVLAYTSPLLTRKTDAFSFDVDVSDADYIKIKAYVEWGSSVIISNVQLFASGDDLSSSEDTNSGKPLSITTLGVINEENWQWNEGAPKDFSNGDYTTACNYVILTNGSYRYGHSVEYRLDGKYTELSGMYAPHTEMGEEGYAYIQVFADDVLIYTSPNVTKKTDLKDFSVNISGAKYVKIQVYVEWGSSIIISDVTLK